MSRASPRNRANNRALCGNLSWDLAEAAEFAGFDFIQILGLCRIVGAKIVQGEDEQRSSGDIYLGIHGPCGPFERSLPAWVITNTAMND